MKKKLQQIIRILAPYQWVTIWMEEFLGWKCIVQYDSFKEEFKSYITDGKIKMGLDINLLVNESPTFKESLKRNGIKI